MHLNLRIGLAALSIDYFIPFCIGPYPVYESHSFSYLATEPLIDCFQGYFEDRRPSSNCDPYAVTDAVVRTCCLGVKKLSRTYTPNDAETLRKLIGQMQTSNTIHEQHEQEQH